jgi:hypothetical protein
MPVLDFLDVMKNITGVNGNLKKRRCGVPKNATPWKG